MVDDLYEAGTNGTEERQEIEMFKNKKNRQIFFEVFIGIRILPSEWGTLIHHKNVEKDVREQFKT